MHSYCISRVGRVLCSWCVVEEYAVLEKKYTALKTDLDDAEEKLRSLKKKLSQEIGALRSPYWHVY